MRILGALVLLVMLTAQSAQAQNRRLVGTLKEDLATHKNRLSEVKLREQRVLELRIRHDLGLPVRASRYLTLSEEQKGVLRYADPGMLAEAEGKTRKLARQLAAIQDRIESAGGDPSTEVAVPFELPGEPDLVREEILPPFELVSIPEAVATPAMPGPETQGRNLSLSSTDADGEVHLIKGSRDRAQVGRVLLRLGETYQVKAVALAAEGSQEDADKYYELASREFMRAKQELDPLVWEHEEGKLSPMLRDDVQIPVMFLLAQCEEKLRNFAVASELYLDIQNLDKVKNDAGTNDLGSWGLAADVAKRVMEFMLEHGEWAPVPPISSIQWPSK